jgi:hypothetical protein
MIDLQNLQKDNKFMIGAAIFVAILIILSGLYYAVVYFGGDEATPEEPIDEKITVDDQISPFSNQGILVQFDRFRNRGLLDSILKIGTSWKNPPNFYYIATIDGLEYISKDVAAAGGASSEVFYTDWDTMFQENRIMKDIDEEQEISSITIKIMERESTGLLGLRSQDVVKEEIHLTYDYRTGRWDGDDSFLDDDGYGHYVGDNYEVWFNVYQTDYDGDYIPYWTEVNVLGTDPRMDDSKMDPDNDGITTDWEWKWGYDPHSWDNHYYLDPDVDGIQNIEEYQMAKYFADPFSQDIYMETDGMEKGGLFDIVHEFYEESGQIMIERFAQHGINLYIDNGWPGGSTNGGGELLMHYDVISQESGNMLQFYKNNFADERKGIFRYTIVGHNAGFCIPSKLNRYDTIAVDSSPYRLIKRTAFTARTQRIVLAAATLHELGHSLGIAPWTFEGNDNLTFVEGRQAKQEYADTWGDYYSVMNYYHIWDKSLADYSTGENGAPYDQNDYEHFFLPTFEVDSNAMEDPLIEPPGKDRIIDEEISPLDDNWKLEENLTNEYHSTFEKRCYVKNVDCDIRFYVPSNMSEKNMNGTIVKVFAKPLVEPTFTQYSLIYEVTLDENGDVVYYDQQSIIDDLRS